MQTLKKARLLGATWPVVSPSCTDLGCERGPPGARLPPPCGTCQPHPCARAGVSAARRPEAGVSHPS